MLEILFKSQIGLLSVLTIGGATIFMIFWLVYFIRQQNKKDDDK